MNNGRPAGSALLTRLAAVVIARPRTIVAIWAIATLIGLALAVGLLGQLKNRGFFVAGSQSDRAATTLMNQFPEQRGTELVAVVRRRVGVPGPSPVALVRSALRGVPGVLAVRKLGTGAHYRSSVLTSETTVVSFRVNAEAAQAERSVPSYRAALARRTTRDATLGLFGGVAVTQRYSAIAAEDLRRAERITFPVTLVVLLIAFVSVLAAMLPLLLAGVSLVVTFACLYLLGRHAGLSVFVTNTASVLALALSIDFALFMVTRFREELARPAEVAQAITRTMASTGRAVALSAVTISIALLAMLGVGVDLFSSMAIGATLATLVAALAALTLLPSILVLLGPRVDRLGIDSVARAARRATLWHRLAAIVTRRPVACALGAIGILLLAAAPVTSFHLELHTVSALPKGDVARRQADEIARAFHPGTPAPTLVVTRGSIPRALWADRTVAQAWPAARGRHGWRSVAVILRNRPDSAQARGAVRRLRRIFAGGAGTAYVGGATAEGVDLLDRIGARTPLVLAITLAIGALVLCAGLRSIVIPIKAAISTLLSVAATIGIVLRVLPSSGGQPSLEFFVPLVLFAIVFGLSVDYEVFLLSRIREAVLLGQSNAEAVRSGLVRSGRAITLAGLTLATVFVGFATSDLLAFRQLGVGVAVAILLDVTLVRCVLVPASVVILGRWNWWFFGHATSARTARGAEVAPTAESTAEDRRRLNQETV